MAPLAHRIVIEPTSIRGERGQYYRVYFRDAVLIEETWNPDFEAFRKLVARGFTAPPEVWRIGSDLGCSPSAGSRPRWSGVWQWAQRAMVRARRAFCKRTRRPGYLRAWAWGSQRWEWRFSYPCLRA